MRRILPKVGEQFVGYYFGLLTDTIQNGKRVYAFEKNPYKFTFKTTDISGSAVFTSSKGFEQRPEIYGDTLITQKSLWRIQTNDSFVPFIRQGLIKVQIDGVLKSFTITKTTSLSGGSSSLIANRTGFYDTSKNAIVIEMV